MSNKRTVGLKLEALDSSRTGGIDRSVERHLGMEARMVHMLRVLFDGLRLRCPRCERGRMFRSYFSMHATCPACGLAFERSSGEITGGMAINTVATLAIALTAGIIIGVSPSLPLAPALLSMVAVVIVFPIVFYPVSRGLWAAILFLTSDNAEPD
jgi:uncharacterized protein (DUF983 family)